MFELSKLSENLHPKGSIKLFPKFNFKVSKIVEYGQQLWVDIHMVDVHYSNPLLHCRLT